MKTYSLGSSAPSRASPVIWSFPWCPTRRSPPASNPAGTGRRRPGRRPGWIELRGGPAVDPRSRSFPAEAPGGAGSCHRQASSDNEELDDAPESAQVKRTAQESVTPEAFILRQVDALANNRLHRKAMSREKYLKIIRQAGSITSKPSVDLYRPTLGRFLKICERLCRCPGARCLDFRAGYRKPGARPWCRDGSPGIIAGLSPNP